MRAGPVIVLLFLSLGCSHRAAHVTFAERKCVRGTVEFNTVFCEAMQPGDEVVKDSPCPARMVPRPISVCVVVDPKTGALTDVVVAKGQDPFDIDDDEAAAADKPRKHSILFWRNHRLEKDKD
jgi:hypothetical protein